MNSAFYYHGLTDTIPRAYYLMTDAVQEYAIKLPKSKLVMDTLQLEVF